MIVKHQVTLDASSVGNTVFLIQLVMEIVYVIQDGVIKIVKYTLGSVTQNVTAVSVLVQTNAYNALLMHRQTLTTIAFVTNISPGTLAQFTSDIVTLYATVTVMVLDHTSASDA